MQDKCRNSWKFPRISPCPGRKGHPLVDQPLWARDHWPPIVWGRSWACTIALLGGCQPTGGVSGCSSRHGKRCSIALSERKAREDRGRPFGGEMGGVIVPRHGIVGRDTGSDVFFRRAPAFPFPLLRCPTDAGFRSSLTKSCVAGKLEHTTLNAHWRFVWCEIPIPVCAVPCAASTTPRNARTCEPTGLNRAP